MRLAGSAFEILRDGFVNAIAAAPGRTTRRLIRNEADSPVAIFNSREGRSSDRRALPREPPKRACHAA